MSEKVETLDDQGSTIIQSPVDPNAIDKKWNCSSYPFEAKTTIHCEKRWVIMFGTGTKHHLQLWTFFFEMHCVKQRTLTC